MFEVGVENYFDPVHRSWISRRPAGRAMFYFIKDSTRTMFVQGLNNIVSANEMNHLHHIQDEPFLAACYPSGNYSVFSHVVGSLYLSAIVLAKIRINGSSFLLEWLHDEGLWEEFLVSQAIRHLVRLPYHRVISKMEGFSQILKENRIDILRELIAEKGKYYDCFLNRYQQSGANPDPQNGIKFYLDQLPKGLNIEQVYEILEGKAEGQRSSVLHLFEGGDLCLSHLDRIYRLSFYTGEKSGILDLDSLFSMLNLNLRDDRVESISIREDAINQVMNLLLTFYRDLSGKVLADPTVSFYKALLKTALELHVHQIDGGYRTVFYQLLFHGDEQLISLLHKSEDARVRELVGRIILKRPIHKKLVKTITRSEVPSIQDLVDKESQINQQGEILMAVSFPDEWYDKWLSPHGLLEESQESPRPLTALERLKPVLKKIENYTNQIKITFFPLADDDTRFEEKVASIWKDQLHLG